MLLQQPMDLHQSRSRLRVLMALLLGILFFWIILLLLPILILVLVVLTITTLWLLPFQRPQRLQSQWDQQKRDQEQLHLVEFE